MDPLSSLYSYTTCSCTRYFGFMDHPTFTKAVRHLPVHEITGKPAGPHAPSCLVSLPQLTYWSGPDVDASYTERATGVQLNRFSMFMSPPGSEFVNIRAQDRALRPDVPPAQIHASWWVRARPADGLGARCDGLWL